MEFFTKVGALLSRVGAALLVKNEGALEDVPRENEGAAVVVGAARRVAKALFAVDGTPKEIDAGAGALVVVAGVEKDIG